MNRISRTHRAWISLVLAACAAAGLSLAVLSGCHKGSTEETAAVKSDSRTSATEPDQRPEEGVSLSAEEIRRMGIVTTPAAETASRPEVSGFAVVFAHETIAQAVAELRAAVAAARQSRAAFERTHRLSGTPGAMPADTQETAERQAASDRATLELARQRLSSTFGQNPPWKDPENSAELHALASGKAKLIHVTFPLGSLDEASPGEVRLARINGTPNWHARPVWPAPADATVPGRSFFAILNEGEAGEGEHLLAWAPAGAAESGVLIPASAALISSGKFWCYIEEKPGRFVRREFDPGRPTAEGYFVKEGVRRGEQIVTAAAGQLLARETNPSTEAE